MIEERRLLYLVVAMAGFAAAYGIMVGLVAAKYRQTLQIQLERNVCSERVLAM